MEFSPYFPNNLTKEELENQEYYDILLSDLIKLREKILKIFPENIASSGSPALLDLESRKESKLRQIKHIHQSCSSLVLKYNVSTKIKILHLIDGYISSYKNGNYYICCFLARYAIELNSIVNRLKTDLLSYHLSTDNDWLTRGESFFQIIFRANYSSKYIKFKEEVNKFVNISDKKFKPLEIKCSIKRIVK